MSGNFLTIDGRDASNTVSWIYDEFLYLEFELAGPWFWRRRYFRFTLRGRSDSGWIYAFCSFRSRYD